MMKKIRIFAAQLCMFLLCACVSDLRRPSAAPELAVFSGGVMGGMWIECNSNDPIRHCKIYNYTGKLFEQGEFEYKSKLDKCDPTFILSDYHFKSGFLMPISVQQIGQKLVIQGFSGESDLAQNIVNKYREIAHISIENVTFNYKDACQNGTYLAKNIENNSQISGRIWAGKYYQLWK